MNCPYKYTRFSYSMEKYFVIKNEIDTEKISRKILPLFIHPYLKDDEIFYIIKTIKGFR